MEASFPGYTTYWGHSPLSSTVWWMHNFGCVVGIKVSFLSTKNCVRDAVEAFHIL